MKKGITGKNVTRRQAMQTGAKAFVLTSAIGIAPKYLIAPARARTGYAPGMTGGPTGFPGAERYQYNEGMSEGRAIEGIKKLKAEGKIPAKLNMLITSGAIGQYNQPFPEGAPTVADVWQKETGIEIEFTGAGGAEIWTKVLQDVTTSAGTYDIFTQAWNSIGDLVSAGGAKNLDEYVAKYQPDWADPARGAPTPQIADLLYKYDGSYYTVSLDGDFQTWVYRTDLFNDPKEQNAYRAKYGSDLGPPATWQDVDQISAHFKRKGLNGHTNLLSPFWGLAIFYGRYVSKAKPNMYFFDDDGNPLLDSEQGIQAAEEHVKSLQWASRDALSWTWAEAYGSMADLSSTMISTFTNLPKFNDRMNADGTPATPLTGKLGSFLPPGTRFGDDLVRRSVIYYNINAEVSALSKYPEAAYLFLQWCSSTRTFSWMSGNPGGYFDPFQIANFEDPLVIETYHDYHVPIIRETIKRSAPTINFAGQTAFDNALDEQLQSALAGQITAEQAMKRAAKAWRKIIRKKGEKRMVEAIRKSKAAWPTIIDKA
jgi:multiple sugar transport system substrate-binding protein